MKRRCKQITVLIVMIAMLINMMPVNETAEAAKKATLKASKQTIEKGMTKKIGIKNKNPKNIYLFFSSNKKIATVSKSGNVKGIRTGKAVITVKEKYKVKKKYKISLIGKVKVTVKKSTTNKPTPIITKSPNITPTPLPTATQTISPTLAPTQTPKVDLYVSSNGNDSGNGTKEQPFRTLERAKEAVRNLDKSKGDIVVEIADGFYPVGKTINFSSEDSGNDKCTIYYQSAKGAKPIISGGKKLNSKWEVASEVSWLKNGLKAYKTSLSRNEKLRAIYVNGSRAVMTTKSAQPTKTIGSYKVTKDQAPWAWASSTTTIYTGAVFASSFGLSADTRNPQNIEIESGSTWAQQLVCVDTLKKSDDGGTEFSLQMPYAALAQNLGWGTAYSPKKTNKVSNVFEWLSKPGEFYFDQSGSTLYYIPKDGEDINNSEVIIPEVDQILEIRGNTPRSDYVQNVTFKGLSFAYTDWNLFELEGSHGYASVQGAIVLKAFSNVNQHDDIYRSYDVPPAAIRLNTAKNVDFINGEIKNTGYLGIHLENDVSDCDVSGNYIGQTGGAGVVVGHPQHVYENDTSIQKVKVANAAGPEREKFAYGTEAVPKNIKVTNNYLLENCYFFPGNSPITSFFTYNLQVLHNFVYKCSYSGMSIGWGWCNFDGVKGSDSQLPGYPTTTSRNNHVNYNRVEEICSLLQDAGGIYTLGQQGNNDWTEYSEMSFNYINAKRAPQVANGSKMVNGFHPDEGSAFIKFDSNVVTNIIRNVYELNNWKRKHDMVVTNGFSNTNRSETTAPNCTLEQYVNAQYIWPEKGYETVLYSGLEDNYVHMVGKDVIPDTDYELAANVRLSAGKQLKRRGLLTASDEVWLAKAGTQNFKESDVMTKAPGNAKSMAIPKTAGEYKLYIRYANGSISAASTFTLYVGESNDFANVAEGQNYNVSNVRPLELKLQDSKYDFTLNSKAVANGDVIKKSGTWTLQAVAKSGGKTFTIVFTTSITDANRLLTDNITVSSEQKIKFANVLSDSSKTIWLAPSGLSAFSENDPTMSKAAGNSSSILAPKQPGTYILTVVDSKGGILSQSDAFVTVN